MTDAERAARLFDIKPQSPWQPIETAPKDGTTVLAYCPGNRFQKFLTDYYSEHQGGGWLFQPTHWMPLPEPPQS